MIASAIISIYLVFILTAFAVTTMVFVFWAVFWGHIKGAPFVPSNKEKIATMIELAEITPNDIVYDLGSGDGAILFQAAKKGARAIGIEINPFLVAYSRFFARRKGLAETVIIKKEDFRNTNLKDATIVFLYLWPETNASLKEKLLAELPKGAKIISNSFPITGLTPLIKTNNIFLYRV